MKITKKKNKAGVPMYKIENLTLGKLLAIQGALNVAHSVGKLTAVAEDVLIAIQHEVD
jgi:hypothetical protein